jgi:hypothetical protein
MVENDEALVPYHSIINQMTGKFTMNSHSIQKVTFTSEINSITL